MSSFNGNQRVIDLRSDTITRPSDKMRQVMSTAEVGDDVFSEDPTVIQLQNRVSTLFDKEAALYFPTGTMSNLTAVMTWCGTRGKINNYNYDIDGIIIIKY